VGRVGIVDGDLGEQTAQACANACLRQVSYNRRPMSRLSTAFCASTSIVTLWVGGFLWAQDSPPPHDSQPLKVCSRKNPPPCADKPPVPTYTPDPGYSKEAERAKIQGTVILEAVVDTNGAAHDISVARPLGYGLEEEAIKALKKWKFKPAESLGKPVPVQIRIEVAFRLPGR
jgi:TonB family protein